MSIFNFIGSFVRRLRDTVAYPDPVRDWLILCVLSAIVFVGMVMWNVWAFDTVSQGGVIGAPVADTSPVFNRSSLDTIHSVFASRAEEEAKYRTGTYRFTDPSQ